MSYVREVLQPDEKLLAEGRLHWVAYWRALVCLGIALALIVLVPRYDPGTGTALYMGAAFMAFVGLCFAAHAWFRRWITEIGVTDRRVIYKSGFISRRTMELNMDKVETVLVDQSLLGRILGYGTLTVRGTGESWESLPMIADPVALRNAITAR